MKFSIQQFFPKGTSNLIALIFLVISIVCYVIGVIEPLMVTKYQILNIRLRSDEVTLFDSVVLFWKGKEYFISLVILVFTFILPVSKYIELGVRIFSGREFKTWQSVDKWNMIDVFLVALLLLNFKMNSNFIVMSLGLGTQFIAIAVLTRLVTIMVVERKGRIKNNAK